MVISIMNCVVIPHSRGNSKGLKIKDLADSRLYDDEEVLYRGNYYECSAFAEKQEIDYYKQPCGYLKYKEEWLNSN